MQIAIAQINSSLGDFKKNSEKITNAVKQAHDLGCSLVIFPEAALFGYHPFDLLERREVVKQQNIELQKIQKKIPQGIAALVGCFEFSNLKKGRPYFNSVALLERNKKPRFFRKQLLPTGDVFDEGRFIERGHTKENFFSFKGRRFLLTICEDIWAWPNLKGESPYLENPLAQIKGAKVDLVINVSASPYFPGKQKLREYCVKKTAQHFKAPMVYVNLVGAQDEIIFDGGSFGVNARGQTLLKCRNFVEDFNILNLETQKAAIHSPVKLPLENVRMALVLGIRDFCQKTGIERLHLGLSGGIDSALVACLAVEAMGSKNVSALTLTGPFTTEASRKLAAELAKRLGLEFSEINFNEIYKNLTDVFSKNLQIDDFGLVHENAQARIRGLLLMAYSNHHKSMLLNTSNKSELACGYSTLYGDQCGGLSPIGDLTKAQVYGLAELYQKNGEVIPAEIFKRAPSAELRENQKDEDSLPKYSILDAAVVKIVEKSQGPKTSEERWLLEKLYASEFKRWQAPPILKVTSHSFGRGRRFPVAHRLKG